MRIKGEDADQVGTPNANLTYTIVRQDPPGTGPMFMINKYTGDLFVRSKLDREVKAARTELSAHVAFSVEMTRGLFVFKFLLL